jgi:arylsulfatase A-like enzyme
MMMGRDNARAREPHAGLGPPAGQGPVLPRGEDNAMRTTATAARWTAAALMALAACWSAAPTRATAKPRATKPNILFVYIDDMGWRDVGFMGSDFFETPHLDKLSGEGMVFTNAYSCAANCAPARACLLSGQYTPRHRVFNVGTGPRGNAKHRKLLHVAGTSTLDPTIRTWAHCLQAHGYATATMGKWHLSADPIPYGFDVNIGGTHSGGPPRGYYPPHNVPGLRDAPKGEYVTDRLSDEAVKFIRKNKDKPWMLYLTHFAVHTPLNAKKELVAKYQAKKPGKLHKHVAMATMIQAVDDGVGKIKATLDELGLTDNTIIVFYSDNGGFHGATDMAPLRGVKGTYYEGGIREPFFVKWPGVVKPGTKTDEPIIGVDLFPTFLEMAGAPGPKGQAADGVSIVGMLKGKVKTLGPRALYWHFPAYLQAGGGSGREARDILFRTRPVGIIRLGDWKLHEYFEDGGLELYNLRDDISEATNLAKKNPEKTRELLERMRKWRKEIGAPVPAEPNPQYDAEAEAAAKKAARDGKKLPRGGGRKRRKDKAPKPAQEK